MKDILLDIPNLSPDTGADVKTVDIPVDILQLCDPWLQHLWGLRGTYNGTLIDFEARREELEQMMREKPCQTSASAPATAVSEP